MLERLIRATPWRNRILPRALFVSSYPPRACGIATFTADLRNAYDRLAACPSPVVAVSDDERAYRYDDEVVGEIQRDEWRSYDAAAATVNAAGVEVVNVQHEYGLFGGEWGDYLIQFYAGVHRPIVTTLHTLLPEPDGALRAVTREACNRSEIVVVMSRAAKTLLETVYGIDARKVRVVPHGAPAPALRSTHRYKRRLGLEGATVIGTFGLIGRGKGIEYMLEAMPAVLAAVPNAIYLLCGQTHPNVRRREGEAYRESLRSRAEGLGIADRVRFIDHYLSNDEVVDVLQAMDLYVSPSLDLDQVVSGTLSYAAACGRPVIATAYAYARELLADQRGLTVPVRDADSLAKATIRIARDGRLRRSMGRAAHRYARAMTWPAVAAGYEALFVDAVIGARRAAYPATSAPRARIASTQTP